MIKKLIIGALFLGSFSLQAARDRFIESMQADLSLGNKIPFAVKKASSISAVIITQKPFSMNTQGVGTGFFVNDSKTFVTNFHVVDEALMAQESDPPHWARSLKISHDGETFYPVKRVKNISVLHDLVVLEVEGYNGDFLKLSNDPLPDRVYAIGFPYLKFRILPADILYYQNEDFEYSLSVHWPFYEHPRGLSGAPVVNFDGDIVGVLYSGSYWNMDAIKTPFLKQLLEKNLPPLSNIIHTIQDQVRSIYDAAENDDPYAGQRLAVFLTNSVINNTDDLTINMLKKVKDLENESDLEEFQKDNIDQRVKQAAKLGHPSAMYVLGGFYLTQGQHYLKGVEWIKKSAEAHYPPAQHRLAHLYQKGIGIKKSNDKAFEWLKKAAHQNHPQARFDLAEAYMRRWTELGDPYDKERAFFWLTISSKRGNIFAQFTLALMYLTGSGGIQQNTKKALEYLHYGARLNYDPAQFLLGTLYKTGALEEIIQDEEKGVDLIEQSKPEWHSRLFFNLKNLKFTRWAHSEWITQPMDPLDLIQMAKRMEDYSPITSNH